jgi:hypothetical protein
MARRSWMPRCSGRPARPGRVACCPGAKLRFDHHRAAQRQGRGVGVAVYQVMQPACERADLLARVAVGWWLDEREPAAGRPLVGSKRGGFGGTSSGVSKLTSDLAVFLQVTGATWVRRVGLEPTTRGLSSEACSRAPASCSARVWSASVGDHFDEGHAAGGDGAGLVQHHRVDAAGGFEDLRAPDQDAELGSAAGADQQRGRCGQAERAWAGDDQYGDGGGERHPPARRCPARIRACRRRGR